MKKKTLIYALFGSLFLATLTSCGSEANVVEPNTNEVDETLYKKVFDEFKKSFSDITYDDFRANVSKVDRDGKSEFDYLYSYIILDSTGSFSEKRIYFEESTNVWSDTFSEYIKNEWVIMSYSKHINDKEYRQYEVGWDQSRSTYYKHEYTYEDNGNETTRIQSYLINNEWINDIKTEYTYDSLGKLTIETSYYNIDNEWVKIGEKVSVGNKLEITYDATLTEDYLSLYSKVEYTYDDKGHIKTMSTADFNNGEWLNKDKYEFTYKANGQTSSGKEFKWINNDWVKINEYVYLGETRLYTYSLKFNDDGTFDSLTESSYDDNGERVKQTVSKYINNEWVKTTEYIIIGDSLKLVYSASLHSDGTFDYLIEYTYDANGNKISETNYNYTNKGILDSKNEDSYDENGNELISILSIYKEDKWVYYYKTESTYDENGKKLKCITSRYIDDKWINIEEKITINDKLKPTYYIVLNSDGSFRSKTEYIYDENGNKINEKKFKYIGGEWVLDK